MWAGYTELIGLVDSSGKTLGGRAGLVMLRVGSTDMAGGPDHIGLEVVYLCVFVCASWFMSVFMCILLQTWGADCT